MGTRLYPLSGGDGDGTKVWYPLGLGMGMGMNFFYGDGYGIVKPVPAPPRCHPYTLLCFFLGSINIPYCVTDKICVLCNTTSERKLIRNFQ